MCLSLLHFLLATTQGSRTQATQVEACLTPQRLDFQFFLCPYLVLWPEAVRQYSMVHSTWWVISGSLKSGYNSSSWLFFCVFPPSTLWGPHYLGTAVYCVSHVAPIIVSCTWSILRKHSPKCTEKNIQWFNYFKNVKISQKCIPGWSSCVLGRCNLLDLKSQPTK